VRVRLRGINSVNKTLKDGTRVTYWYAWKGGPRLDGEAGDPEFVASYNRAVASLRAPVEGLLLNVLVKFQQTDEFRRLAERTREDYREIIDKKIEPEFGDLPLAALSESKRECRRVFREWRNRLAIKSKRQADYAWAVLARILAKLDSTMAGWTPIRASGEGAFIAARGAIRFGRLMMSSLLSRRPRATFTCP